VASELRERERDRNMAIDFDAWARSPAGRRFQYYDPHSTFSNCDNDIFIKSNGKPDRELNPDTEALFRIGKEAFKRLTDGEDCSKEEFDDGYASYWAALDGFRDLLVEMLTNGAVMAVNDKGQKVTFDAKTIDDGQVISMLWKAPTDQWAGVTKQSKVLIKELFLFHTLREIDNALIGIALDGREAVVAAIEASNALSNAIAISSGDEQLTKVRKEIAYHAAIEKLKRDPKQREPLAKLPHTKCCATLSALLKPIFASET
jgi:hypothetical protein